MLIRIARLATLSLALAFAVVHPASPCSIKPRSGMMTLDETWRERFREHFEQASAVYVVRVRSVGPLTYEMGRMACDEITMPPPPPAREAGRRGRRDYEDAVRAMDAANERCQPEAVEVTVKEVIKGQPRTSWIEQQAFIDVVDEPPSEPTTYGGVKEYGRDVGDRMGVWCGWVAARRMSASSEYLVFIWDSGSLGLAPSFWIRRAFLAEGDAPFLAEARRLAAELPSSR